MEYDTLIAPLHSFPLYLGFHNILCGNNYLYGPLFLLTIQRFYLYSSAILLSHTEAYMPQGRNTDFLHWGNPVTGSCPVPSNMLSRISGHYPSHRCKTGPVWEPTALGEANLTSSSIGGTNFPIIIPSLRQWLFQEKTCGQIWTNDSWVLLWFFQKSYFF